MPIQKKSYVVMTTYHSFLSVFMMNSTPNGGKKHCEITEPESCQMAKNVFLSSSSSSNSCESFTMVFTQNSSTAKKEGFLRLNLVTSVSYLFCIIKYSGDPLSDLHSKQ